MAKVYFSLFVLLPIFILSGCSSDKSSDYYIEDNAQGVNKLRNYYIEDEKQEIEIGNPYSFDSGHYAGYEWAERTGKACSGNSTSFIEGCEEYYRQIESLEK